MNKKSPRKVYTRFNDWYATTFGKEDYATHAKVAWPILTEPKSRGGLGLTDPLSQSKALLAKFVVRGLRPGNDC